MTFYSFTPVDAMIEESSDFKEKGSPKRGAL